MHKTQKWCTSTSCYLFSSQYSNSSSITIKINSWNVILGQFRSTAQPISFPRSSRPRKASSNTYQKYWKPFHAIEYISCYLNCWLPRSRMTMPLNFPLGNIQWFFWKMSIPLPWIRPLTNEPRNSNGLSWEPRMVPRPWTTLWLRKIIDRLFYTL